MRILFDGFWWLRGPVSNRHLMISMIKTWADTFPEDELMIAVRRRDFRDLVDLPAGARIVQTRLSPHGVSTMVELPGIARRERADVVFAHNFTPLWHTSVVFLHDVLFLTNPEWFTTKERAYFSLMPLSSRRARAIVTSSHAEARRIAETLNPRMEVTAVGLGLGDRLGVERHRPAALADVDRFLLTVGRLNVRKNLGFACLAAVRSGVLSPEFPLVIAGSAHGRTEDWPLEVQTALAAGAIITTGYVSDEELAWLYAHCRAFLFFSRGEGFGLPPLEALHSGAPVIASDIPVMREILGSEATFVDINDVDGAAAEIARVGGLSLTAADSARRAAWASQFTWDRTVRQIHAVVESVVYRDRSRAEA